MHHIWTQSDLHICKESRHNKYPIPITEEDSDYDFNHNRLISLGQFSLTDHFTQLSFQLG